MFVVILVPVAVVTGVLKASLPIITPAMGAFNSGTVGGGGRRVPGVGVEVV